MILSEATELIEQLKEEVRQGIDVEFNNQWIKALRNSISVSLAKKYNI